MAYVLNPSASQSSVASKLATTYPHVPVFPDGMIDTENGIERFSDGSIKPFIVLWFSAPKRQRKGRSFSQSKLDSYRCRVDVVVVARNGTEARTLLNDIGDKLVDFRPTNSGHMVIADWLWSDARGFSLDDGSRPTRFAATIRFEWTIQANHTT